MKKALLCSLFIFFTATTCWAGQIYIFEATEYSQGNVNVETKLSGQGKSIKMDSTSETGGDAFIFQGDKQQMLMIDHQQREYVIFNAATRDQIAGKMDQAMSQMNDMLKNLPPEQRAMVEKMMKNPSAAAGLPQQDAGPEVKNTHQKAKKEGYPATKYEIWSGNRKTSEIWIADWKDIPGGSDIATSLVEAAGFMKAMMEPLSKRVGRENQSDNVFALLEELKGFPVLTREFNSDGAVSSEMRLKSTKATDFAPGTFEPPSNYRQTSPFGM